MTTEEKLKDLILKRYDSVREFTIAIDIPYTTMSSIFKRGIDNSSVSNIIKICKALNISADALADGEIRPIINRPSVSTEDNIEITDFLSNAKDTIIHSNKITLDGKIVSKATLESIIDTIEIGVEIAKKKANKS